MPPLDVLRSGVVLWVVGEVPSGLVIDRELRRFIFALTQLRQEASEIYGFLSGLRGRHQLGFTGRKSY